MAATQIKCSSGNGADEPFSLLRSWLDHARAVGVPAATTMALTTVSRDREPSARIVDLKRLEKDALVFTSALWTRKARDIDATKRVAALFHWPQLGRQVHVAGQATQTDRQLSEELFASREPSHRLQTLASRQGEVISDLGPLRERLEQLSQVYKDREVPCPADWGAFRLAPAAIEFWELSPDRLHHRLLFERSDGGWHRTRLAP